MRFESSKKDSPVASEIEPERTDHFSFKDISNGQHWNPILEGYIKTRVLE